MAGRRYLGRMSNIPGPGNFLESRRWLRAMLRDPLQAMPALRRRYGDLARISLPGGRNVVLVSHPDGVQHVLQAAHRKYHKARTFEVIESLLGKGLLTSEGAAWRTHRRLAQPAFHHDHVAGWADMMVASTSDHVARWKDGVELDLAHELRELTLRIVGKALFSIDLTGDGDRIGKALDDALAHTRARFQSPLGPFVNPPSPSRARFNRAANHLDAVVTGIIAGRDRDDPGTDLLGLLMAARDEETGKGLSDLELRDEVMTFLLAGHETTAHALTWTLWLLASSGQTWRRIHHEIDEVLGDRPATVGDLPALTWTRAVVDEGLRLYPPAYETERSPIERDVIDGHELTARDVVIVSQWVTHRHPDVWDRPLAFDPERFLDDRPRHRFAYFPFGGGPRLCIGAEFALVEAVLVLATLLQSVDIDPVPGFPVTPWVGVTLRPAHGLRVRVRRR